MADASAAQGSNSFVHQGIMENAPIHPDPNRRLGHPGAIAGETIFENTTPSEATLK